MQNVGESRGKPDAAEVGGDDDELRREARTHRLEERYEGAQVVDRDLEEALDLWRVQVDRHEVLDAGRLEQMRDESGHDRSARRVPAVAARVAEVGEHRDDALGGGATAGVGQRQQLDEALVDRRPGRLHDDGGDAAQRCGDRDAQLAVRKALALDGSEGNVQQVRDLGGEQRMPRPRDDRERTPCSRPHPDEPRPRPAARGVRKGPICGSRMALVGGA